MKSFRLEAADQLALLRDDSGRLCVSWRDGSDWLGPIALATPKGPAVLVGAELFELEDGLGPCRGLTLSWDGDDPGVRTSVRAYAERPLLVFRIEATRDLEKIATGRFEQPCVAWPWFAPHTRKSGGIAEGASSFAHGYTEFGLPWQGDACCSGYGRIPGRPSAVTPLWLLAPDGHGLMFAPWQAFHEQIIAVPESEADVDGGVSCGWHGDLDQVPAGFASELALWACERPRLALETHGSLLRAHHATPERSRYRDVATGRLSYWTDNGAAYWYRTEPGLDMTQTLGATVDELRAADVPFAAVELDSWFYPHERLRPVNPEGQVVVPPSGAIVWEAREDVLPDGVSALADRLGSPPLIAHGRHFSSRSPYWEEYEAWVDADRAHPTGPELFDKLMAQAASWGVIQYEQDWLVEAFLGVRGLREAPGRAARWQADLDRAAGRHGLSLLWCMATPADFFASVALRNVASIRTSGDYRYVVGNGFLWTWYLHTSALARALDLPAYKDVFLSSRVGEGLDGDPHAEAEALLAALSAGPVGLGDRRGRTDRDLVMRCCRPDGLLVKPDVPIAALDRCYTAHAFSGHAPLIGETYSRHAAGRWVYLASLHASMRSDPLDFSVSLQQLGDSSPDRDVLAFDWRSGEARRLSPDDSIALRLASREWDYRILCPITDSGIAIVGDATRYATAGDRRLRGVRESDRGVALDVLGAAGETVRITGWSAGPVQCGDAALIPQADGRFHVDVAIPDRGWQPLRIERR